MTKNINSWNTVTKQWIKLCSESTSVIWQNWFILLGLQSKSETTEASSADQVVSNSLEIIPQVQLGEKQLIVNQEENFTDNAQNYWRLEQENQQKSQSIIELQAKITQMEKEKKLNEDQILLSKKDSSANSSEIASQVQWLEQQLKLKEEQLKISDQKIIDKDKSYWLLQQENQQKSEIIKKLQAKVGELESIATIGNKQLNKWRSKTFFN